MLETLKNLFLNDDSDANVEKHKKALICIEDNMRVQKYLNTKMNESIEISGDNAMSSILEGIGGHNN